MKISFRKIAKKIHLFIGLLTGIIVFVVCLTGCIYTFQQEIKLLTESYYKVEKLSENGVPLPLSEQFENVKRNNLGAKIQRIYTFKSKHRTTMFLLKKEQAYYFAFLNPYTGEVLKEKKLSEDFFIIILYIHTNLLLGEIGGIIVKWSVLLFFIALLTGIVLWLPKNKKTLIRKKGLKAKFKIKKTSNSYMKMYQWHSVLGIYAVFFLLIISLTGLAWSFSWIDHLIYSSVTFEQKIEETPVELPPTEFNPQILDEQQRLVEKKFPEKEFVMYFLPSTPKAPMEIKVTKSSDKFGNTDSFTVNPSTGEILITKLYEQRNRGEKLRNAYYDLHTGSILGFWGKVLVFIASFIGSTLPITGFLLWRKRKKH